MPNGRITNKQTHTHSVSRICGVDGICFSFHSNACVSWSIVLHFYRVKRKRELERESRAFLDETAQGRTNKHTRGTLNLSQMRDKERKREIESKNEATRKKFKNFFVCRYELHAREFGVSCVCVFAFIILFAIIGEHFDTAF